jgi:thermitase
MALASPTGMTHIGGGLDRECETMQDAQAAFLTQSGALLKLVVLSILLERGLAFVFEFEWFERLIHTPGPGAPETRRRFRGLKAIVALAAALSICSAFQFDVLSAIFSSASASIMGIVMTAFIAAGGSNGAIAVFQGFLGFSKEARDHQIEARRIEAETAKQVAIANAERARAEAELTRITAQVALNEVERRVALSPSSQQRQIDRSRIALRLVSSNGTVVEICSQFRLRHEDADPNDGFDVFRTDIVTADRYADLILRLKADSRVETVMPVFGDGGSQFAFPNGIVIVRIRSDGLSAGCRELLRRSGAIVVSEKERELMVRAAVRDDPHRLAVALLALPDVELAEADLTQIGQAQGAFAPEQRCSSGAVGAYHLARIPEAWAAASGLDVASVTVAVIDDGVDLLHHDITAAKPDRFDTFAGTLSAFPLSHDHHGTACAALAVAVPRNNGMKGVGAGAKLIAIRVNHRLTVSGNIITSSFRLKQGIEAAVARGADVLSLSLSAEPAPMVEDALRTAATTGRQGRGCVIVAAAGNDGGSVRFPARLDCVIGVAGCDDAGRLFRGSNIRSNFGAEVDITAPAMPMFTALPSNKYSCEFQGTSAATAIVAGAVALVLAANPELRAKEVRDLLVNTARPERDSFGGRPIVLKVLNAEAAVKQALPN